MLAATSCSGSLPGKYRPNNLAQSERLCTLSVKRIFVLKCKSMISANVIKGVHELLDQRGIRPKPDETFGDMVARALDISARQSEILLERLHDGASVDEAAAAAEIDIAQIPGDLLVRIATAIGTALGRVNRS
jgi:hypothetical protein